MKPRRGIRAALVLAAALAPAPAAAQTATAPAETAAPLADFDTAWAVIDRAFGGEPPEGVDWDAVRDELRPRAAAAGSPAEVRAVIREMLERTGRSHFVLVPREGLGDDAERASGPPGEAGLDLRLLDGEAVVTRVAPGGAAEKAGVRPGWTVESVAGRPTADRVGALGDVDPRLAGMLVRGALLGALDGPAGSPVEAVFRDGRGRAVERTLERRPPSRAAVALPGLPPMPASVEWERRTAPNGAAVGVIRWDLWALPLAAEIDRAVDRLRDADALVLDLRGNPGGVMLMPNGVSGHFFAERTLLGEVVAPTARLRIEANPRTVGPGGVPVRPFAGPVAVLVDGLSASTTEFFAGGMRHAGRARVFGTRTAGQALPAATRRLPGGDVLMYAVGDFLLPDGRSLEGEGVVPDEAAPATREALLAGEDPAMDAALRWIARETAPRAGR